MGDPVSYDANDVATGAAAAGWDGPVSAAERTMRGKRPAGKTHASGSDTACAQERLDTDKKIFRFSLHFDAASGSDRWGAAGGKYEFVRPRRRSRKRAARRQQRPNQPRSSLQGQDSRVNDVDFCPHGGVEV